MVKAVIFDIDGTLIDWIDLHAAAWREALRHFGHDVLYEEVREQIGKGGDLLVAALLPEDEVREFRTGDYEEIIDKASCLSLLSNAMLVWNTVRMREIAVRLRAPGETISDDDLARISPPAFAHVIPNGTHVFDRHRRDFDMALVRRQ
jgi:beta-phosphoglucomutase-like phosphatase (HAD superfamily)